MMNHISDDRNRILFLSQMNVCAFISVQLMELLNLAKERKWATVLHDVIHTILIYIMNE